MKGRVYKSTGSWYTVLAEGKFYECRLRGKMRLDEEKVTNPVAVGDWVEITPENEKEAIIKEVLPRENYIIRKSTRKKRHSHRLAANIDQAVLVVTLAFPRTSLGFIDRFLVSCESFRIPAVLVFNKSDLLDDEALEYYEALKFDYEELGYKVLLVSAEKNEGIEDLKKVLEGKTSLFSGHSGVGKSTLLNLISPHIDQRIGEVSESVGKGVHTTTFAEMFEAWENTFVIDTPGIKELGLWDIGDEELSHYFPEMREYIGECKFNNCTHTHEPGCAFRAAMEEGKIAPSRYESYLSILEDEDSHR
ncbi:ribosome small subunit-dependent GTPase A [Marivirga arenosa]|uniref:Small ribosomal subunit biogenesis GTPase RsgA n=1 Tax=Marivirga arenosa TaxID=3059076 RepID=A0AA49JCI1_9BACT|nr:ribosome small subunit-dependent GTPase A [Marivirga sp. BKB1-2]WKK79372.1 ribosome small subunit-dependent GTPase A [Marivirga sp. BKB1-2]